MIYYYLLTIISISTIIYLKLNNISKLVNLYDFPNKERKFHRKPTPLVGGSIFIIFIALFNLFSMFYNIYIIDFYNQIIITFAAFVFFIFGFVDDKYEINAFYKLTLQILLSFFFIYLLRENFLITKLNFLNFDFSINLNKYSLIFTAICLVIFLNAFNMYDGINGQAAIYASFIFFVLIFKGVEVYFCLGILLFSILFLILNLQGKTFLGDNGVFLISFVISLLIIKAYKLNTIYVDEIFLLMILPGVDMLRLFITRSFQKKSPFFSDRQHLHHYLLNKFDNTKSVIFISLLSISPFLFSILTNTVFSIFVFIIFYFFCIYYYSKKS